MTVLWGALDCTYSPSGTNNNVTFPTSFQSTNYWVMPVCLSGQDFFVHAATPHNKTVSGMDLHAFTMNGWGTWGGNTAYLAIGY